MRWLWVVLLMVFGSGTGQAKMLDQIAPAPAEWVGHVFVPRLDFPHNYHHSDPPWKNISFRHAPEAYLQTVLRYALEGQDLAHWDLRDNKVRDWYHMPWLGIGPKGREYIHGLTRGSDLPPHRLSPNQGACRQTWSLAFFNAAGGAMLGRIWNTKSGDPDLSVLPFLDDTVSVKLVFTDATSDDDPMLQGAPELEAAIDRRGDANGTDCPTLGAGARHRVPTRLRLLQVDLAVREHRASYKTGWVFGSFRYDGRLNAAKPWQRLRPIGLMWGNDPELSDAAALSGEAPRQSLVLGGERALGRGGRMNGPADHPQSACASCHMAAQWPRVAPLTPPDDWARAKCWFRNVDGRYPFGFTARGASDCGDPKALQKLHPLDFSLQLSNAMRNWAEVRLGKQRLVRTAVGVLKRDARGVLMVDGMRMEWKF